MSSHLLRGISPTALSPVKHIASVQIAQPSSIPARGLPGLLMRSSSRQFAVGRCHLSLGGVRYTVQKGRACADDPRDTSDLPERFVQVQRCPASSNRGSVFDIEALQQRTGLSAVACTQTQTNASSNWQVLSAYVLMRFWIPSPSAHAESGYQDACRCTSTGVSCRRLYLDNLFERTSLTLFLPPVYPLSTHCVSFSALF
jgi:hypothetical protein